MANRKEQTELFKTIWAIANDKVLGILMHTVMLMPFMTSCSESAKLEKAAKAQMAQMEVKPRHYKSVKARAYCNNCEEDIGLLFR